MSEIQINTKVLQDLIKSLKKPPTAKIGILGSKNARSDGGSNASIGAVHEFGAGNVPQRSFLRIPLVENLQKHVESSGLLNEKAAQKIVEEKSLKPWVEKLAIIAKAVVLEGFDTGGFGKWAPLKESTLSKKKVKQILVETQQLRDSIEYRVDDA
jgi:phage gpG-like protein